jgi:hypothetical protein
MRLDLHLAAGGDNLPLPADSRTDTQELRRAARDAIADSGSSVSDDGIIARVIDFVSRQIERFSNALSGGSSDGLTVLAWGMLLLVVVGIGFILWRARKGLLAEPLRDNFLDDAVGRPPIDWRNRAVAAAQAGDVREALRCWLRVTIAEWNQRGVVVELAGKTLGEYRLDAFWTLERSRYDEFAVLTKRFESVWYGDHPAQHEDLARAQAFADNSSRDVALRAVRDAQFGDLMVAP